MRDARRLTDVRKKLRATLIAPIDQAELICRMIEAGAQVKRPAGKTAADLFREMDPIDRDLWVRASTAAMDYWRECIAEMQAVS